MKMRATTIGEWRKTKLGEICDFLYGKSLPEEKRITGNIPVYGSNGIVGYHNKALVQSSGIIIGRKGSVGLVHFSEIPFYPIDTTFYITANESNIDLRFLYYLLKALDLKRLKADVGVPGINREMAHKEPISIPTNIEEQKSIARILTTVQNAITEQEELIIKLKELKRSMMQCLFIHGTKGEKTKMTEIGEVPESWEMVEIGNIGKIVTGSTPSTKRNEYYNPEEVDFIAPADIGYGRCIYSSDKQISLKGFEVSRSITKDAVCCVCIGSSIGKVAKAHKDCSTTNQQINSIVCNEKFDSDFIYYTMIFYSDAWRSHATFGPVPILSKGVFCRISVPISYCQEEQARIGKILVAIDQKIEVAQEKISAYQKLFKTLLYELMSGERNGD